MSLFGKLGPPKVLYASQVLAVPAKTHFVPRCIKCRMIWNRDTNARRNILLYLGKLHAAGIERPALFQQHLSFPPEGIFNFDYLFSYIFIFYS